MTADHEPTEAALRTAGVAHDMNNVLAAIDAVAEDALARAGTGLAAARDLDEIRSYVRRGAALVATLLDAAAPPVAPPPLPLAHAIADLAPLLRRLAGPAVAVELHDDTPGLAARIDPLALERVLGNLVANARDAMPAGGRVTLRTMRAGAYAAIEVTDIGGGIAPDLLAHLFAPFVTGRPERGGHGIGLAAARGLVRAAGGDLTACNLPGGGARFVIRLPLADTPRSGVGTVLLVEDEEPIRAAAERRLASAGWHVRTAASAEAALATLAEAAEPPALVICDVSLPDLDGLALLERLREVHPDLPAILTSGYADADLQDACARMGARFLAKPVSAAALLDAATSCTRADVVPAGENI